MTLNQVAPGHGSRPKNVLPLRARRAAREDTQSNRRFPRRFILFGPRVVPLEVYLLSQSRTQHSMQKAINHLLGTITRYKAMVGRRDLKLQAAHRYIEDLKRNGATHPQGSPPPSLEVAPQ